MGHPRPVFAWRSKFSDLLYKADPQQPVKTIKAHCGQFTGPFHWENRAFSIAELKRLQTFPDEWEFLGTWGACIKQLGNAVPAELAYIFSSSISDQLLSIEPQLQAAR